MIRGAAARVWSLVRASGRPGAFTVTAEPEAALLASAAALKRLGARITRYDVETSALEARLHGGTIGLVVHGSGDRSTIEITSEGAVRPLMRRLREELAHPSQKAAP